MTATPKALSRSVLTTSSATLYTVPTSTITIITNVLVVNTSGSSVAVTLAFDGVVAIPATTIAANTVVSFDMRQPLAATKTITGFAGAATSISCHIGGVETV